MSASVTGRLEKHCHRCDWNSIEMATNASWPMCGVGRGCRCWCVGVQEKKQQERGQFSTDSATHELNLCLNFATVM